MLGKWKEAGGWRVKAGEGLLNHCNRSCQDGLKMRFTQAKGSLFQHRDTPAQGRTLTLHSSAVLCGKLFVWLVNIRWNSSCKFLMFNWTQFYHLKWNSGKHYWVQSIDLTVFFLGSIGKATWQLYLLSPIGLKMGIKNIHRLLHEDWYADRVLLCHLESSVKGF